MKSKTVICMDALANLWRRDISELQRTGQPGGAALIKKLKKAMREIHASGKGASQ